MYNKHTDLVLEHYTTECLSQLEKSFILIIQSFDTYFTILEEQEQFTKYKLQSNYTEIDITEEQQLDKIAIYTGARLLTGRAYITQSSWAEVNNASIMMDELTKKLEVPKREVSCTTSTIQNWFYEF